jgi:hypothetical protein
MALWSSIICRTLGEAAMQSHESWDWAMAEVARRLELANIAKQRVIFMILNPFSHRVPKRDLCRSSINKAPLPLFSKK